jgi:hypothetical protein
MQRTHAFVSVVEIDVIALYYMAYFGDFFVLDGSYKLFVSIGFAWLGGFIKDSWAYNW